jgi:uncharacterized protein (TIGR03118 family)
MFTRRWLSAALPLSVCLTISPLLLAQHYTRTDLTQNSAGVSPTAAQTDPNLVNAWGLSRSSGSPWWISDNGTGRATLYNAAGVPQALVVTMAVPDGVDSSAPTGTIFNYAAGFEAAAGQKSIFLFCTEEGTVTAWNPTAAPTTALVRVNRNKKAVYKGCALAGPVSSAMLYAANFQTGRIDVFDNQFNPVMLREHAFRLDGDESDRDGDREDSSASKDNRHDLTWAPFNIQNVGGNLIVTFARKAPGATDETAGAGFGRVVIFDASGRKIRELQRGTWFNAPWGVTLAPADFGTFSHRLLIGNFGDGTIHAFNAVSGKFEGTLLDAGGAPIRIDGLWALSFAGGNANSGAANAMYFTSGPMDESAGIFGNLMAVVAELRGNTE